MALKPDCATAPKDGSEAIMRTFDYRHVPPGLFRGETGDLNVLLHEDKGKLELLKQVRPAEIKALRDHAHIDNVEASMRIEGLFADSDRIRAIAAGATPTNENEWQAAGYAHALELIEQDAAGLDLSTTTIVGFYEALYAHRNLGNRSRYRRKDYIYVQVDGHLQAMPVSPVTAFETPLVLGGACDSLADAFIAGTRSALILAAVFTVDFLCIRPFEEGNGRISRLFADLLLSKAGFDVARYTSIDRLIENSAMEYYDALNACVEGWDRGANNYVPFVLYWLGKVHEAYLKVFADIESQTNAHGKSERVRAFVQSAKDPVSKRTIRAALPDVSEATVEAELGRLVKERRVEKIGRGRATAYHWLG